MNPRRILIFILAVGIVAGLAVVTTVVGLNRPEGPASGLAPAGTSTAPTTTPAASSGDAGDAGEGQDGEADERVWSPVVVRFATRFTDTHGRSPKAWRTRLIGNPAHPDVTDDVDDQLATVDPRTIPAGRYDSYEILTSAEYQLAVKVTYRQGWAMVLYLVTDGHSWAVSSYDRWEE